MPLEISYEIEERLEDDVIATFDELLVAFCRLEEVPIHALIDMTIVDDEIIRQINSEYRQKDVSTDVLSFPQYERDDDLINEVPLLYGDVVISLEHAKAQAESYNHSLKRELSYLFVHSLLHLRGYDHMLESDKKEMRQHEEQILHEVGISRDD
jgi:metalloprotein, YbeY family